MPLSPAEARSLTRRYQQRLAAISERTIPAIDRAWDALAGFRDDDLPIFTRATLPATTAAKASALAVAVAYSAAILRVPAPPVRPADVATAYNAQSSFLAVRKALSDGYTFTEARIIGQSQAQAAVRNLTISTARTTGDVFAERANVRITGWVRNAEANSCPWCAGLDGVVFLTAEAGDFGHDRCNCTVSPLVA